MVSVVVMTLDVLVVEIVLVTFVEVFVVVGAIDDDEVEPIEPIFSLHKGVSQRHSSTLNKPWKASCSLQPRWDSPRGLQVLRHCNVPFKALTIINE